MAGSTTTTPRVHKFPLPLDTAWTSANPVTLTQVTATGTLSPVIQDAIAENAHTTTITHAVNPSNGTVGNALTGDNWYDAADPTDPANHVKVVTNPAGGTDTYILVPASRLPLLGPLLRIA